MNNAENKSVNGTEYLADIIECMMTISTPHNIHNVAEDIERVVTDYHYFRWGEYEWYVSPRHTLLYNTQIDGEYLKSFFIDTLTYQHEDYVIYTISFIDNNFKFYKTAEVHNNE